MLMLPPRSRLVATAIGALLALPASGGAQARTPAPKDTMPTAMMPPAGKCRIWMEGVPPSRQPAPTDCATALRQKPANGTVVYGPPARDAGNARFQSAPARDTRSLAPAPAPEAKKAPPDVKRKPE